MFLPHFNDRSKAIPQATRANGSPQERRGQVGQEAARVRMSGGAAD